MPYPFLTALVQSIGLAEVRKLNGHLRALGDAADLLTLLGPYLPLYGCSKEHRFSAGGPCPTLMFG